MTRVALLGGGHAHALVLLKFRNFISKNLDLVLVSETPSHTYSGMVPGVIAGHYEPAQAQINLAHLAREAGAQFLAGRVQRLDLDAKRVVLEDGGALDYDVLSLNLGSTPRDLRPDALPVKPFEAFIARWRKLLDASKPPRIAVVGAGAGGVELAMAMMYALSHRSGGNVELFSERFDFPEDVAA